MNTAKVMTRIHTDSTSGKSIATRISSSKKAKHIELKRLFVQQLVQSGKTIRSQRRNIGYLSRHLHQVHWSRRAPDTSMVLAHMASTRATPATTRQQYRRRAMSV